VDGDPCSEKEGGPDEGFEFVFECLGFVVLQDVSCYSFRGVDD